MLSLRANNIHDIVKPFHVCSKIIGLTAFTIERVQGAFVVSLSWYNIVCILLSTSLSSSYAFWYIVNQQKFIEHSEMELSEAFENGSMCVSFGFLIFLMCLNMWFLLKRKHFSDILNLLADVDDELDTLKVPLNFRYHKKIVLLFICSIKVIVLVEISVAFATIFSLNLGLTRQSFILNLLILLAMFVTIEMSAFLMLQFTFWMWAVKLRYKKINLFLKKAFFMPSNKNLRDGNDVLNKAARLHDKLVDVSKYINICYGLPVRWNKKLAHSLMINVLFSDHGFDGYQLLIHNSEPVRFFKSVESARIFIHFD